MAHLHSNVSSVPAEGDTGDNKDSPPSVNLSSAENSGANSEVSRCGLNPAYDLLSPIASASGNKASVTPDLVSAGPDRGQFFSSGKPAGQQQGKSLPEFHELPQRAQEHIQATCPYFTKYAHLSSAAARKRARKADQRAIENGAGCLGPEDHLRAAIRDWLTAHPPADQPLLDFAAVADLPRTSQKQPSVPTEISAPPAGETIKPHHLREWVEKSGIDEELARACIRSIKGDEVLTMLRPNIDGKKVGRARKQLDRVLDGGWQCLTLKLGRAAQGFDTWGCFKPDHPRAGWKKDKATGKYIPKVKDGKPVAMKYEHPAGVPTQPFFLPLTPKIAERIARTNRCLQDFRQWEAEADRSSNDRWLWFLRRGCTVWITEGAKKTAALLTAGKLAIGLSGIWNGCDKDDRTGKSYLKPQLRRALNFGVKRVITAFDWAEPESQGETDVRNAVDRLCRVIGFESKGTIECNVIDLPGPEKGVDDILVAHGAEGIDELKDHCLTYRRWRAKNNARIVLERIQTPIDITSGRQVRQINQRYLNAKDLSVEAKLLAIVSPMETGKTHALVEYSQLTGLPTFLPLHRRSLAANVSERFHLPYQSEGKLIRPWLTGSDREINVPPANASPLSFGTEIEALREADAHGKVVVMDSSHAAGSSHLDPESCRGALLILDEWDASAMHLLTGRTEIQSRRTEILENFTQCLRNARQVIIASAHLHEQVIKYLENLLDVHAHVLVNEYRPAEGRQCFVYSKDKEWLEELSIQVHNGKNVYISVTAQKANSVYGSGNLATYISENLNVPRNQILVVDGETTRTTGHAARGITAHPEKLLQFRVVIATPCIETGVSIQDPLKHFDAVFGMNSGKTSAQSTVQAIGRVRSDVPRFLFVGNHGETLFGGGTTARDILHINGTVASKTRDALLRAGIAEAELPAEDSVHVRSWAALVADHNLLASQLPLATRALLKAEGYSVIDGSGADAELQSTFKDQLKDAGAQNRTDQCEAVSQTEPAPQDEIEALDKKSELTTAEQQALEHAKIARDFGLEKATATEVDAHRRNGFAAFRTELLLNEMSADGTSETLVQLDALTAMKRSNITRGAFIGDFVRAWQHPRINLLHQIGAINLIRRRDEMTMVDPDLVAIHNAAKRQRSETRIHLGIDPCTVRTSTFLKKVAERLGYSLFRQSQSRNINGKRQLTYVLTDEFYGVPRHQIQAHIKDNIERRHQQALDDLVGDDASPFGPTENIKAALFQQEREEFLDYLDWAEDD